MKKRVLSLLIVGHIANDAYFGFLPPLLPLLVVQFDISLALAGLLSMMFSISGALIQPLFGYFLDRFRKGWLIAAGPLGGALVGLMVYMPNYYTLLALFFIAGLGSAIFHPLASVTANQASGGRKGLGVSIYIAGGRLGVGIGAAVATFIVTRWGMAGVPLGALLGIAVGLPLIFMAPDVAVQNPAAVPSFSATLGALRHTIRPLGVLWLVNLTRTIVTMTVGTFLPLYVVRGGGSIAAGGRGVTIFLFAAAAGGIFGGHLSDRFGRREVVLGGMLASLPALALMFLFPEPWQTVFLILSGAALYAPMGVSVTYAQELLPEHAALVTGFMLGVLWFVSSMFMVAVGALADLAGLAVAFPAVCLIMGAASAALSFGLPRLDERRA